ncbi:MAG: PIN domain-containing protein [Gemmatimonadota bacterium]|nr:PIN domain-containing protein [Gemmatimonadota bacterium]
MTALVIDASVWVSAADPTDDLSEASRAFLSQVAARELPIVLPEFAKLEIACALARRLRSAEHGRSLTDQMLESPRMSTHSVNRAVLRGAIELGTRNYLRAGDALYAAVTQAAEGQLVAWDRELIERAGAFTPEAWLDRSE